MGGETTRNQTGDDMSHLSHAGACAQMSVRENTLCEVFCPQHVQGYVAAQCYLRHFPVLKEEGDCVAGSL